MNINKIDLGGDITLKSLLEVADVFERNMKIADMDQFKELAELYLQIMIKVCKITDSYKDTEGTLERVVVSVNRIATIAAARCNDIEGEVMRLVIQSLSQLAKSRSFKLTNFPLAFIQS